MTAPLRISEARKCLSPLGRTRRPRRCSDCDRQVWSRARAAGLGRGAPTTENFHPAGKAAADARGHSHSRMQSRRADRGEPAPGRLLGCLGRRGRTEAAPLRLETTYVTDTHALIFRQWQGSADEPQMRSDFPPRRATTGQGTRSYGLLLLSWPCCWSGRG